MNPGGVYSPPTSLLPFSWGWGALPPFLGPCFSALGHSCPPSRRQSQFAEGSGMVRDPERAIWERNIFFSVQEVRRLGQASCQNERFPGCCLPVQLQGPPPPPWQATGRRRFSAFLFFCCSLWLNVKTGYIWTNCLSQAGLPLGLRTLLSLLTDTSVALRVYILMVIKTVRDAQGCRSPASLKKRVF